MIRSNLFDAVLKKPAERGSSRLLIVSGYASAAMAYRHFESIPESVRIELIVGMSPSEGVGRGDHVSFQKLVSKDFRGRFICRYLMRAPSSHGKIYTWLNKENPSEAFVGSANYTQVAFFSPLREEAVVAYDPSACADVYRSLIPNSIECVDPDVEKIIRIHDGRRQPSRGFFPETRVPAPRKKKEPKLPQLGECIAVSLLDRRDRLPERSGLNWGQRPEYGRDKDQAYIRIPSDVARAEFFPPRGVHFTLATDDGNAFDCVVAQQNEKAIETPQNNALLGRYFRKRLGLPSGEFIKKSHLLRHGRTDVTICKIDDESYLLDFSPQRKASKRR